MHLRLARRRLSAPSWPGAARRLFCSTPGSPAELPPLPWPSQLEEVTAPWLTETLRAAGRLPEGCDVRGFAATPLPAGPLSRCHRLACETASGGVLLVLKTAPLGGGDGMADAARQLAAAGRSHERDIGFYAALAAARSLGSFKARAGRRSKVEKDAFPDDWLAPIALYTAYDKPTGRAVLLLPDCGAVGLARADSAALSGEAAAAAAPLVGG